MDKQTWYSSINNSNKLEMYSGYKHDFELQNYLDFVKDKKFRFALTKLRLASHDLDVERGRYENIDRSERICRYCKSCIQKSNMGRIYEL